ncbi:MAG: hypothetical protein ACRYGP_23500 [Janthinobacterium lividum]
MSRLVAGSPEAGAGQAAVVLVGVGHFDRGILVAHYDTIEGEGLGSVDLVGDKTGEPVDLLRKQPADRSDAWRSWSLTQTIALTHCRNNASSRCDLMGGQAQLYEDLVGCGAVAMRLPLPAAPQFGCKAGI